MKSDIDKALVRLRMRYVAPAQRRCADAWGWWSGELAAMLPERLRASLEARRQQTFLQLSGNEVVVFHGSIERMQEIGRAEVGGRSAPVAVPPDTRAVVLLLPPERVLRRRIRLPAATEENLRGVLAFDMDQQTPFTADQVYFDAVVADRSAQAKSIDVDLVVAPRRQLDPLLESLAALDLAPDVVSARRESGGMFEVNLLPSGRRRSRPAALDRVNFGLAALCLVLLIAAAAIPIVQKRQAIAELEPRVAAAMDAAREGSRIRSNIEAIATGSRALVARKQSTPSVMRLLDELTRIVPDGTWISQLNIEGREIQIQGQSPAAASLIGLIDESDAFANPQFRSPVTQIPRSNLERFHLSAEWTGSGSP